ncbi:hypothetical protein [Pleomorphovibrio marinus]|uniref:hypothetical protein n=1 Tax=Pleomorphovibrio marinus TaxID=2164132 RepID=UPI000E0B6E3E|nr:hypothetical protein [Pleomorphovibrio marinus]
MEIQKLLLYGCLLFVTVFFFSCGSEEGIPDMEEELFFSIDIEGKNYTYRYPLPANYLEKEGEGFIESIPDDVFNNFFIYSNRSQVLIIDVATNCSIDPGPNSCIFLALSFGNELGNHAEAFIHGFALDYYFINTLRVTDPEAKVNLEVNVLRYHPEKMLMEGDFSGMVFTEYPTNSVPETANRTVIHGEFRVGILANPDMEESQLLNQREDFIKKELR